MGNTILPGKITAGINGEILEQFRYDEASRKERRKEERKKERKTTDRQTDRQTE